MKTRKILIGIFFVVCVVLLYGCFGIAEITNTDPTESEKNIYNTLKWLDYKDTDFGISLKHPSNWEPIKENPEILAFLVSNGTKEFTPYSIKIVRLNNQDGKSVPEALNFGDNYSMSKIGVDDLLAIKLAEPPESFSHFYYVERAPYIYKFVYMNLGDKLDYVSNQSFYEMLNSFRFIPFATEESLEAIDETSEEITESENSEKSEKSEESKENVPEEIEKIKAKEETAEVDEPVMEKITEEITEESDTDMHYFTSGPYHFKALYPTSWYYAGENLGGSNGVLHRYNFTSEQDGETLIMLDIIDQAMPSGALKSGDKEILKISAGGKVIIHVRIDKQVYKISASSDMEDMANKIALSIEEGVEEEE